MAVFSSGDIGPDKSDFIPHQRGDWMLKLTEAISGEPQTPSPNQNDRICCGVTALVIEATRLPESTPPPNVLLRGCLRVRSKEGAAETRGVRAGTKRVTPREVVG
mmetsp:Transcript_1731/g.2370  ORF Transcript_1731/g.2370 Transcript_1731/m.2370 type:complete len:105 (-) Transcript_1731:183-497(-)